MDYISLRFPFSFICEMWSWTFIYKEISAQPTNNCVLNICFPVWKNYWVPLDGSEGSCIECLPIYPEFDINPLVPQMHNELQVYEAPGLSPAVMKESTLMKDNILLINIRDKLWPMIYNLSQKPQPPHEVFICIKTGKCSINDHIHSYFFSSLIFFFFLLTWRC